MRSAVGGDSGATVSGGVLNPRKEYMDTHEAAAV